MSKYYDLNAVINGEFHRFSKRFASRNEAINYIFRYAINTYNKDMQVEEEYPVTSKHDIEYVCDNYNRFRISRVLAR